MEVFSYFVHKRLIETKTMISNLTEQESKSKIIFTKINYFFKLML